LAQGGGGFDRPRHPDASEATTVDGQIISKPTTAMANNLSRKELLGKVYKMVPPMLEKFHKGSIHPL
jgi:hypothetical protein